METRQVRRKKRFQQELERTRHEFWMPTKHGEPGYSVTRKARRKIARARAKS